MEKKKDYIFILIMTFIRYLGDCFFYTFLYVFLMNRGLNESKIGLITCLFPLLALVSNPLWTRFIKNTNQNRKAMIVITILEGLLIMVYSHIEIYEWFIVISVMLGLIDSPFYYLHDGFCDTFASIYNKKYANIRSMGTFGYLAATLIAALVLYLTNDNYMLLFYISGICLILTSVFFIWIKPINLSLISKEEKIKPNYKAVLKNKTFMVFLIVDFLIVGISKSADNYVSTFFTSEKNLSASMWSLTFTLMLVFEMLTMFITTKIKKINANQAFIILGLTYLLRTLIYCFDLPLWLLVFLSLLRGVAFGIYLPTLVKALEEILGIKNVTTGLFIVGTVEAVIRTIGVFTFGNLITYLGYKKFFLIVSLIILLGNIINIIFSVKNRFKYPSVLEDIQ